MKQRSNGLRDFAKQYKREVFTVGNNTYTFIHCPAPNFGFLESAAWYPPAEDIAELREQMRKVSVSANKDMSFFMHHKTMTWLVIDHLWVAMLPAWGNQDMKKYMRSVFSTMISKAWDDPKEEEHKPKKEKKKKEEPVQEQLFEKEEPPVQDKKQGLLDKIKDEVVKEEHKTKYGISKEFYETLRSREDVVFHDFPKQGIGILDFHKYLYKKWGVLLKDAMNTLVKKGYLYQDKKHPQFRKNYELTILSVAEGHGINKKYWDEPSGKELTLPFLTLKGVFYFMYALKDAGLVPQLVVPNLDNF